MFTLETSVSGFNETILNKLPHSNGGVRIG